MAKKKTAKKTAARKMTAGKKSTTKKPAAKKARAAKPPKGWPFDQSPNAAAITLRRIVLPEKGEKPCPILYVSHDADDHAWQFLDGGDVAAEDAAVVGLGNMLKHDPTLAQIADLPPGWIAVRLKPGGPWRRGPHE